MQNQGFIEEVFQVADKNIHFFAALVRETETRYQVRGWTGLNDKNRTYFHSPHGNRMSLKKSISGLCRTIAAMHGAHLTYHKLEKPVVFDLSCLPDLSDIPGQ